MFLQSALIDFLKLSSHNRAITKIRSGRDSLFRCSTETYLRQWETGSVNNSWIFEENNYRPWMSSVLSNWDQRIISEQILLISNEHLNLQFYMASRTDQHNPKFFKILHFGFKVIVDLELCTNPTYLDICEQAGIGGKRCMS